MEYYDNMCIPPEQFYIDDSYNNDPFVDAYYMSTTHEYMPSQVVLTDGGDSFGVSTVHFDKYEELIWTGNQGGHVTSYYGPHMQKYTSFQVHATDEICQIVTTENSLLILTKTSLRQQIRRGIPKHTHKSEIMVDLQCLLPLDSHRMLIGGQRDYLIDLDVNKMIETKIDWPGGCLSCCGSGGAVVACWRQDGTVALVDTRAKPRTLATLQTHLHLVEMDMQGDILATIGYEASGEATLAIWDVRAACGGQEAALAAQVIVDPLKVRFLPTSGRLALLDSTHHVGLVNTDRLDLQAQYFRVETHSSVINTFDISPTSQAFVFGDQAGYVHLFSHEDTELAFNTSPRETEFAEPIEQLPFVSVTNKSFKYSSIKLPQLNDGDKLFSDLPEEITKKVYRRPKPIDAEILKSMKMQGPIGYAPNPKICKRNEMPYLEGVDGTIDCKSASSFGVHNKLKRIPRKYLRADSCSKEYSSNDRIEKAHFPGLETTVPNSYCNPMLQVLYYLPLVKSALLAHTCAKEFCLSCELGFLFRMLDTTTDGSCQATNFLRAFRTIPEAAALGLILSDRTPLDSKHDPCSLIQSWTRFILHQMHFELLEAKKKEKEIAAMQKDKTAMTKNLVGSRLGNTPISSQLIGQLNNLNLEQDAITSNKVNNDAYMIEDSAQFSNGSGDLTENKDKGSETKTTKKSNKIDNEETEISQLFGISQHQVNQCQKCKKEEERSTVSLGCALQYGGTSGRGLDSLMTSSLAWRRSTPAWCELCNKFTPTQQRTHTTRLPPILAINCGCNNELEKTHWMKDEPILENEISRTPKRTVETLQQIAKPCRYGIHCSRAGCRFKHPDRGMSKNSEFPHESLNNNSKLEDKFDNIIPSSLYVRLNGDGEVLITDNKEDPRMAAFSNENVATETSGKSANYTLSSIIYCVDDIPKNLVSLIRISSGNDDDTRWYMFNDVSVSVCKEDEILSRCSWRWPCCVLYVCNQNKLDGSVITSVAPAHPPLIPLRHHEIPVPGSVIGVSIKTELQAGVHQVSRVICVRGEGPLEGVPFIDDQVAVDEKCESEANTSTLKNVCQKLKYLVDTGVVFVGHGIKTNIRLLNLHIPPEQIIDTSQIVYETPTTTQQKQSTTFNYNPNNHLGDSASNTSGEQLTGSIRTWSEITGDPNKPSDWPRARAGDLIWSKPNQSNS